MDTQYTTLAVAACSLAVWVPVAFAQSSPAPATAATTASPTSSDFASNFLTLCGRHAGDIGWFGASTILNAILWGTLLLVLGLVVGLVVYLVLRKRGFFAAPWKWYKYIRWAWGLLFIAGFALGPAYAGVWIGIERNAKSYIRDKKMLDQVVGNLLVASCMDRAQYRLTGNESAEKLQTVLADSEALGKLATKDLAQAVTDAVHSSNLPWWQRQALRLVESEVLVDITKDLSKLDPRLVMILFYSGENIDQYMAEHPEAHPMVAALSLHFERLRDSACSGVNYLTRGHIWTGLGLGVLLPVVLLTLFRVIVRLSRSPAPPAPFRQG